MRLRVEKGLPLAALTLLAACGGGGRVSDLPPAPGGGPASDYPMVLGPSYAVGSETFTPADTMNYDAVGRASIAPDGGGAISAAHHTLPLPSYVEVTALDSGKTALVRVERRGPLGSRDLIELSPGAATQLGLAVNARGAVRVRRVNPVEAERALLRAGQAAPARMDTPKSLLAVLQRKLDQQEGRPAVVPAEPPVPATTKPQQPEPKVQPKPAPKPAPVPLPAKPAGAAAHSVVQVGAFADRARAQAAAARLGGQVSPAGRLWRVRLGPFAGEAEAKAAQAKAKAAGYSDARIQRAD